MQLHQPRLAEMVAGMLRERILAGQLKDGDALPRQEDLLAEFQVSKPSLREALRILEAEGLITVRRGNRGGAVVHVPQATNAAYMIGLVLQHRRATYADVGGAIQAIEPLCAGMIARRDDRMDTILPRLTEIHEQIIDAVDDEVEFTRLSRRFHEEVVRGCGNETLILVVGALESLWSSREEAWAHVAKRLGSFPDGKQRQQGIRAHARILQLLEAGDAGQVERHARRHLDRSLYPTMSAAADKVVDSAGMLNGGR